VFKVSKAAGDAWVRGTLNCADPAADTHAVTRRGGDARYLAKAAGWSEAFSTGEAATVTVVDGQIVSVA
jgi:hypothetical protein